ncbi:hypothetical protein Tco_0018558 [Tanacetum coccineum]
MENKNPIRTLRDYSRPSHEGYRNTIELLDGNKVVPLRSDTIRLVQNGCSFQGLRVNLSLKHGLVSRTYSKNPLNMASIFGSKSKFSTIMYVFILRVKFTTPPAVNFTIRTPKNLWEIIENLALYDHEGWNDSRDFAKPVKKLKRVVSLIEGLQGGKNVALCQKDTRSSHEYLNDLEEEYQARALLAKSKIFFKKGTDIAKITRERSKPDKHGHGNGKTIQEPGECYQRNDVESYTSHEPPIGQSPQRVTRVFREKHTKDEDFALN